MVRTAPSAPFASLTNRVCYANSRVWLSGLGGEVYGLVAADYEGGDPLWI